MPLVCPCFCPPSSDSWFYFDFQFPLRVFGLSVPICWHPQSGYWCIGHWIHSYRDSFGCLLGMDNIEKLSVLIHWKVQEKGHRPMENFSHRDYYLSPAMKALIIKPANRMPIHGKDKKDPLSKSFHKNSNITVLTGIPQPSSVRWCEHRFNDDYDIKSFLCMLHKLQILSYIFFKFYLETYKA